MKRIYKKILVCALALTLVLTSVVAPVTVKNVSAASSPVIQSRGVLLETRLAGSDRFATAARIAQEGWKSSEYAVLAAGMDNNLVDALTAAPLARSKNAPILLTDGEALSPQAEAELQRLDVKTVYVTSGSGVIKQAVIDRLKTMGLDVKSLGGSDRFETSVNIAKEMLGSKAPNGIVIATAWSNADALSVASIAASKEYPILLTDVNALPESVSTYIDSVKTSVKDTYVIGGTGVVSDKVKSSLPNAIRAGGLDRFQTNLEILKLFADDIKYEKIYVANGEDSHLVDALAGAPLAAQALAPVILVNSSLPDQTREYAKLNLLPVQVIALGGESVVSSGILTMLTASDYYSDPNTVKGSSDAANPLDVTNNIRMVGDNSTFQNAKVDHSVYIQGNAITLSNITVEGTIFIDPGNQGTTTLKNVKANKVVVLSGAQESIHIMDSFIGKLVISTVDQVRVVASESTVIGNTIIRGYAILDATSGSSFGTINIKSEIGVEHVVEFRGNFTKDIVVEGRARLIAAQGAVIPNLIIAPEAEDQIVTLQGEFKHVTIEAPSQVVLGENTVINVMESKVKSTISVPKTSSIGELTAGTDTTVTGEGTVNGKPIQAPGMPPVGGGGGAIGGGGGNGGGPTPPTITQVNNIQDYVRVGDPFTLPGMVTVELSDNTTTQKSVTWNPSTVNTSIAGTFTFEGTVSGWNNKVILTLVVGAYSDARAVLSELTGKLVDNINNVVESGYGVHFSQSNDMPTMTLVDRTKYESKTLQSLFQDFSRLGNAAKLYRDGDPTWSAGLTDADKQRMPNVASIYLTLKSYEGLSNFNELKTSISDRLRDKGYTAAADEVMTNGLVDFFVQELGKPYSEVIANLTPADGKFDNLPPLVFTEAGKEPVELLSFEVIGNGSYKVYDSTTKVFDLSQLKQGLGIPQQSLSQMSLSQLEGKTLRFTFEGNQVFDFAIPNGFVYSDASAVLSELTGKIVNNLNNVVEQDYGVHFSQSNGTLSMTLVDSTKYDSKTLQSLFEDFSRLGNAATLYRKGDPTWSDGLTEADKQRLPEVASIYLTLKSYEGLSNFSELKTSISDRLRAKGYSAAADEVMTNGLVDFFVQELGKPYSEIISKLTPTDGQFDNLQPLVFTQEGKVPAKLLSFEVIDNGENIVYDSTTKVFDLTALKQGLGIPQQSLNQMPLSQLKGKTLRFVFEGNQVFDFSIPNN